MLGRTTTPALTPTQRSELAREWSDWVDGLIAQGRMQSGHPLQLGGCVVSGKKGELTTRWAVRRGQGGGGWFTFFLTVKDFCGKRRRSRASVRACRTASLVEVRAHRHGEPGPAGTAQFGRVPANNLGRRPAR